MPTTPTRLHALSDRLLGGSPRIRALAASIRRRPVVAAIAAVATRPRPCAVNEDAFAGRRGQLRRQGSHTGQPSIDPQHQPAGRVRDQLGRRSRLAQHGVEQGCGLLRRARKARSASRSSARSARATSSCPRPVRMPWNTPMLVSRSGGSASRYTVLISSTAMSRSSAGMLSIHADVPCYSQGLPAQPMCSVDTFVDDVWLGSYPRHGRTTAVSNFGSLGRDPNASQ